MPVTSTNLIQGPATLYRGTFGAVEPVTVATAPGVGWTDVGGTKDGVELLINNEYSVLEVDQLGYEVGRRRTKSIVQVKTQLAEATLTNLAIAISSVAPAGNVLEAEDGINFFSPNYDALMLDGIAPGGFRRRVVLRKTLSTDSVGVAYKKDAQTLIPVTWTLHWVSASIRPWKIEDAIA